MGGTISKTVKPWMADMQRQETFFANPNTADHGTYSSKIALEIDPDPLFSAAPLPKNKPAQANPRKRLLSVIPVGFNWLKGQPDAVRGKRTEKPHPRPSVHHRASVSRSKRRQVKSLGKRNARYKKITKSMIGKPTNFKHTSHIGSHPITESTKAEIDTLTAQLNEITSQLGHVQSRNASKKSPGSRQAHGRRAAAVAATGARTTAPTPPPHLGSYTRRPIGRGAPARQAPSNQASADTPFDLSLLWTPSVPSSPPPIRKRKPVRLPPRIDTKSDHHPPVHMLRFSPPSLRPAPAR